MYHQSSDFKTGAKQSPSSKPSSKLKAITALPLKKKSKQIKKASPYSVSAGEDGDHSGDYLRRVLAADPLHPAHRRGTPLHMDLQVHPDSVDSVPLAGHEQLLLQPHGLLLDEHAFPQWIQTRVSFLSVCG